MEKLLENESRLDWIGNSNNDWLNVTPLSSHLYIYFPPTEIIDQLKQRIVWIYVR